MILNSTPQNEAVISNVGEIGEFRIRNSAKAFSILSSGLYANKIRAIIRELSCNAVDSHKAAGKTDTPFDVHLPSALEPWFAIRDYGTGLTHDEVTNIYTTYFESTKTNSNDFIGTLGLGSKSPFSYTENFTVVAIKDGTKGVYTAFINDKGVPSIAVMTQEQTSEPAGVEIRFSVEDRGDFNRFEQEARTVYTYFTLRPVVTSAKEFKFHDQTYVDRDIIPGVHSISNDRYGHSSTAIMGNIGYPIEVPNREQTLGSLARLLDCGLVMEFQIGELDIQASREGLSYIDITIKSIKNKLEQLNEQLLVRLTKDAEAFTNLWKRAEFLYDKAQTNLWNVAVKKYVADNKFPLIAEHDRYLQTSSFYFTEQELAAKYNITLRAFSLHRHEDIARRVEHRNEYDKLNGVYVEKWMIPVSSATRFVVNDTTVGAQERAKYHYKNSKREDSYKVFVLEAHDKTKPIKSKKFFKDLENPPSEQIALASSLMQRERATGLGKNVSILMLENRGGYHRNSNDLVWRDAGKLDQEFDDKNTYYYLPLSGFVSLGVMGDMQEFVGHLKQSGIFSGTVYGVRKSDIEQIKSKTNWINIDEYVKQELGKITNKDFMGVVKSSIDFDTLYCYDAHESVKSDSPYMKLYDEFKDVKSADLSKRRALEILSVAYKVSTGNIKVEDMITKYQKQRDEVSNRYPLLSEVSRYSSNKSAIAEYITAIDLMKGI